MRRNNEPPVTDGDVAAFREAMNHPDEHGWFEWEGLTRQASFVLAHTGNQDGQIRAMIAYQRKTDTLIAAIHERRRKKLEAQRTRLPLPPSLSGPKSS